MSNPIELPTGVWLRDDTTVYKLEETNTYRKGVALLRNQITISVSCSPTSPLTAEQVAEYVRILLDSNEAKANR